MRRALAINENSFGADHPNVAISLNNLAQVLQATDRSAEAEPLMRRALAMDEKSLGPRHPNVAIRLSNLGRLLQATGRFAEAEPLMRRGAEIVVEFTRRTGHRHRNLDDALEGYEVLLAAVGKSQGEIEAARAELRRPLADKQSS
jgi:tetratricopeptide (TPR) repeat protein